MNARWLKVFVLMMAGLLEREQAQVIDYVIAENRVLREQRDAFRGKRRAVFTGEQRRRLAMRAKTLGHRMLHGMVIIVTPDTLLRW